MEAIETYIIEMAGLKGALFILVAIIVSTIIKHKYIGKKGNEEGKAREKRKPREEEKIHVVNKYEANQQNFDSSRHITFNSGSMILNIGQNNMSIIKAIVLIILVVFMLLFLEGDIFKDKSEVSDGKREDDVLQETETPDKLFEIPTFETYTDEKFKYQIDIPSTFKSQPNTTKEDKQYVALDKRATIKICARYFDKDIPTEFSLKEYIKMYENGTIFYKDDRMEKEHWYAISMKIANVYRYKKCIITSENTIVYVELVFPEDQGEIYNNVYDYTTHIEKSFKTYRG